MTAKWGKKKSRAEPFQEFSNTGGRPALSIGGYSSQFHVDCFAHDGVLPDDAALTTTLHRPVVRALTAMLPRLGHYLWRAAQTLRNRRSTNHQPSENTSCSLYSSHATAPAPTDYGDCDWLTAGSCCPGTVPRAMPQHGMHARPVPMISAPCGRYATAHRIPVVNQPSTGVKG